MTRSVEHLCNSRISSGCGPVAEKIRLLHRSSILGSNICAMVEAIVLAMT